MTRPEILLDIDGVAANFIAGCLPHVLTITGRLHHHDEVDQFMIEKALGLSEEETKLLYDEVNKEGWVKGLPPYEGAREGVAALREFADVIPVTAPFWSSLFWVRERYEWALDHLEIHQRDVIHTHRKFQVFGDMLIDDKMSHLTTWATRKHNAGSVPVLFCRRYNQSEPWQPGVEHGYRVDSWEALVRTARRHFGFDGDAQ